MQGLMRCLERCQLLDCVGCSSVITQIWGWRCSLGICGLWACFSQQRMPLTEGYNPKSCRVGLPCLSAVCLFMHYCILLGLPSEKAASEYLEVEKESPDLVSLWKYKWWGTCQFFFPASSLAILRGGGISVTYVVLKHEVILLVVLTV